MNEDAVSYTLEDRKSVHGKWENNAIISTDMMEVLNHHLSQLDKKLLPEQYQALLMIIHKISRIVSGDETFPDHWLDISGYARLVYNGLIKEK